MSHIVLFDFPLKWRTKIVNLTNLFNSERELELFPLWICWGKGWVELAFVAYFLSEFAPQWWEQVRPDKLLELYWLHWGRNKWFLQDDRWWSARRPTFQTAWEIWRTNRRPESGNGFFLFSKVKSSLRSNGNVDVIWGNRF